MQCHYKLGDETLYSVKWYKDGNEFYRYVPRNSPATQVFPLVGVTVDLHNSTEFSVVLSSVQLSTSGIYRCEVSGEAPYFETVADQPHMLVVVPPESDPVITGGQPRYHIGDTVNVTCSIRSSKPAVNLTWLINERKADPKLVHGPFKQYVGREGLESSSIVLQFVVRQKHFVRGNMKLKCAASIATIYVRVNEKSFGGERPQKGLVLESRGTAQAPNGSRADRVHTSGSTGCASIVSLLITKIIIIAWFCIKGLI
uniref:Ig-like domain-containing protein n=1 Tax=Dendroctonus ponderosae TaxID=77166 RepID=A0AAR5NZ10_DENPD